MPIKEYEKLDPISHILKRPDMYCGSIRLREIEEYISTNNFNIEKKEIKMSPALLRVFIEPLSNAIDNVERSKKTDTPCNKIKVNIDMETGKTTIWNNGDIVPIEKNKKEKCYNHSMIFGQLLTGSNYDDEEERIISGRNGLGVKLCNVFSTYFCVKGQDPNNKKKITQEWTNNMKDTKGPVVKSSKSITSGFTEVSWVPDFERFSLKQYTDDIIKLYTRFVIDAAMLTKIKIYLNFF